MTLYQTISSANFEFTRMTSGFSKAVSAHKRLPAKHFPSRSEQNEARRLSDPGVPQRAHWFTGVEKQWTALARNTKWCEAGMPLEQKVCVVK